MRENAGSRSNKLMSLICLSLMSFALSGCGRTPGSQTVYDYNTYSGTPGYTVQGGMPGGMPGGYALGAPPSYGGGVGPWHYSRPTRRVYRSSRSWTRHYPGPNGGTYTVTRTRNSRTIVTTRIRTRLRYPAYNMYAAPTRYSNPYAYAPQTAAAATAPAATTGTAGTPLAMSTNTATTPAAGSIPGGDSLGNLTASNTPTGSIPTGATPVAAAPLSTPVTGQFGPAAPAADPTATPGLVPAGVVNSLPS